MATQSLTNVSLLRLVGGFLAVFSVVVGVLILFVIPSACSFVGSIQLVMLGFLFVGGVTSFIFGQAMSRRKAK